MGPIPTLQTKIIWKEWLRFSSEMTLILLPLIICGQIVCFTSYLPQTLPYSSIPSVGQWPRIEGSHLNSLSLLSCRSLCFCFPSGKGATVHSTEFNSCVFSWSYWCYPSHSFLQICHFVVNVEHKAEQNIFFLTMWHDILVALKETSEFNFPSMLKKPLSLVPSSGCSFPMQLLLPPSYCAFLEFYWLGWNNFKLCL